MKSMMFFRVHSFLSTLFPEGESYFVRSVRALRAKAKSNEILDREISAFIGQEAMHSKESSNRANKI
jgi:predicted metal-dependent hydrolase